MKFTDFAIGKKLAVVLSGCTLLVVCLSGLSLWDYQEIGKFQEDSHDRLTKCLLADEVGRGAGEACLKVRVILSAKRMSEQDRTELAEIRKTYRDSVDGFKARANTPKSRQHAVDLDQMTQELIAFNNRLIELAAAGRQAEAIKQFDEKALPMFRRLQTKADEAVKWQEQLVEENQQKQKASASNMTLVIF